ncbi:MAG: 2-C-methyl-D-erythritol 4-phosphate cytidylyltransferase [Rikenellaceae bacterium]
MRCTVIIVAAGRGVRAGGTVAKQFTPLEGGVVLMHTIDAFVSHCSDIVVVLPQGGLNFWKELCLEHNFTTSHRVIEGSSERFLSVHRGLALVCDDTDVVLVHDGVRPFVSGEIIERVISAAAQSGAVVPVVPISDSLRRVGGGIVSRSEIMAVQTPQGFSLDILRRGYMQPYNSCFTDDASVVESAGYSIEMVEGDVRNFKITTPWDIEFAKYLSVKGQ